MCQVVKFWLVLWNFYQFYNIFPQQNPESLIWFHLALYEIRRTWPTSIQDHIRPGLAEVSTNFHLICQDSENKDPIKNWQISSKNFISSKRREKIPIKRNLLMAGNFFWFYVFFWELVGFFLWNFSHPTMTSTPHWEYVNKKKNKERRSKTSCNSI